VDGVALYQDAQALEQLSRTAEDRKKNAEQIAAINGRLSDAKFVEGFGSICGEEFFSYLNISDSLKRSGCPAKDREIAHQVYISQQIIPHGPAFGLRLRE